ncbi:MAG: Type 1 glutamine amidotransferase-like domain-containing protein [Candidatus Bathyarchaeia archaeon]|jgi:peptidase E
MPKLYLLGGENVFRRSAREVNERAFQEAGEPLVVLVFAWARASFDKEYKKRERLVDYFISLGASKVNFVEYSDSKETIAEKTSSSNLIYLTGGLVSVLIERLKNMEVDNLLRGYSGVIVGRSAGALALCKKCVITYRSNSKVKLVGGLGLVDFTLKAHYKPEKDNELKRLSKEEKIYAVPEGSALVYDNGASSFIGEAYLFENGKKRMLT